MCKMSCRTHQRLLLFLYLLVVLGLLLLRFDLHDDKQNMAKRGISHNQILLRLQEELHLLALIYPNPSQPARCKTLQLRLN